MPRGQYDFLVERLRKENLQVTVRSTRDPVTSLGELQPYDTVILANCPREQFSDEQIRMLVYNTRELGAGLILLGGEQSFECRGGWAGFGARSGTAGRFSDPQRQVAPVGALAMIMPRFGDGQRQLLANANRHRGRRCARLASYCGVLQWNGNANWLWKGVANGLAPVGKNRPNMKASLDRMTPGDMPDFESTSNASGARRLPWSMRTIQSPGQYPGRGSQAPDHHHSDGDPSSQRRQR